ncbi:MAG: hypothetical protein KGZ69_13600 [Methylomonas sp.]|nr:hypothetical protein [Methylomonas sp.]
MMNYEIPKIDVPLIPNIVVKTRMLYTPSGSRILREFIYSHEDMLPDLPWLFSYIDFWKRGIDGKLRRVEWMLGSLAAHEVRHPGFDKEL